MFDTLDEFKKMRASLELRALRGESCLLTEEIINSVRIESLLRETCEDSYPISERDYFDGNGIIYQAYSDDGGTYLLREGENEIDISYLSLEQMRQVAADQEARYFAIANDYDTRHLVDFGYGEVNLVKLLSRRGYNYSRVIRSFSDGEISSVLHGGIGLKTMSEGIYPDGEGLAFVVSSDGIRSWERWPHPLHRIDPVTIGYWPDMSAKEARALLSSATPCAPKQDAHAVLTDATWSDAPRVDLKGRKSPPWVKAAAKDLEATSAMFAVEFADRLWPLMFHARTTDEQIAAFRTAFIETVEAA